MDKNLKKDLLLNLKRVANKLQADGETNLKAYEIAFQDEIERLVPDKSWWEVTDSNIFMTLFNKRDVDYAIMDIIAKLKDETTEEFDILHYDDKVIEEATHELNEGSSHKGYEGCHSKRSKKLREGTDKKAVHENAIDIVTNILDIDSATCIGDVVEEVSELSKEESINAYVAAYLIRHIDEILAECGIDLPVCEGCHSKKRDKKLKEEWEDLEYQFEDILDELVRKINEQFPDAHITSDDIVFDDSRAWSLYIFGHELGLPVTKFGAYRNYLGGGIRGPINHNGREKDNTVELGELFAKKLGEIEDVINSGHEDEPEWDLPTVVLESKKSKNRRALKEERYTPTYYNYHVNGTEYVFRCNTWETSRSWGHECELIQYPDYRELGYSKCRYYNRTWERFTYQSCMLGAIEDAKKKYPKIETDLDELYNLVDSGKKGS